MSRWSVIRKWGFGLLGCRHQDVLHRWDIVKWGSDLLGYTHRMFYIGVALVGDWVIAFHLTSRGEGNHS